ncbi:pirin domain-containing protein [Cristinia sonorae]|uniref:Pirin domain-containing protein n=1 Tax=Cristinia sonorae TaxID=1940300 RepID=A0A8K0UU85_9AGAR|nr:pirin domain-containing protein [Cristinia sonorae]
MSSFQVIPRRSDERGNADHGWLKTFHTFSFAMYQTQEHNQFGHLRVLNEDRVQAHTGFGTHGHKEFEIFSYVVSGQLEHRDSMGNVEILERGDVQMTSAGTGIRHSEKAYGDKQVHFLQMWSTPSTSNLSPAYYTRHFTDEEKRDKWVRIVAPVGSDGVEDKRDSSGPAPVHSPLTAFAILLSPGKSISHTFPTPYHGTTSKGYIHLVQKSGYNPGKANGGQVNLAGNNNSVTKLWEGDGAYITAHAGAELTVTNTGDTTVEIILFDVE